LWDIPHNFPRLFFEKAAILRRIFGALICLDCNKKLDIKLMLKKKRFMREGEGTVFVGMTIYSRGRAKEERMLKKRRSRREEPVTAGFEVAEAMTEQR
jgi:hypothetical protein